MIVGIVVSDKSKRADVLVEAYGMLFDILLFGVIRTVYEAATEKQRKIQGLESQLESFTTRS